MGKLIKLWLSPGEMLELAKDPNWRESKIFKMKTPRARASYIRMRQLSEQGLNCLDVMLEDWSSKKED